MSWLLIGLFIYLGTGGVLVGIRIYGEAQHRRKSLESSSIRRSPSTIIREFLSLARLVFLWFPMIVVFILLFLILILMMIREAEFIDWSIFVEKG